MKTIHRLLCNKMDFSKSPPRLSQSKSYSDWLKLIEIWKSFTTLTAEKQGPAVLLSLEGEAQNAALELATADIATAGGVDKIIERLNKIYKKDELLQKYNDLEAFQTYKRPVNTSIRNFLIEFEKRLSKTKSNGTIMSDDLLTYRLIKAANLPHHQEQLIRATVSDLNLEEVRSKIVKIFSDQSEVPAEEFENLNIKSEPTLFQEQASYDPNDYQEYHNDDYVRSSDDASDLLYTRNNHRGRFNRGVRFALNNNFQCNNYRRTSPPPSNRNQRTYPGQSSSLNNWRSNDRAPTKPIKKKSISKGKNPPDRYGVTTTCAICNSINHWAQHCPDRDLEEHTTYAVNDIVLHQSDYDNPNELKSLVAETWNSVLLDCGASKTVCGRVWYEQYTNSLSQQDQSTIELSESSHLFRFGDGKKSRQFLRRRYPHS